MFCTDSMRIDIPRGCARESARLACNERPGWRRVQGRQRAKINKSPQTDRLLLSENTQIVGQIVLHTMEPSASSLHFQCWRRAASAIFNAEWKCATQPVHC